MRCNSLFLLLMILLAGCNQAEPVGSVSTKNGNTKASGPYPECPKVAAYLRKHTNDPDVFEIVEWKSRVEGGSGLFINITVSVREKNKRGAKVLRIYFVHMEKDGKVLSAEAEGNE